MRRTPKKVKTATSLWLSIGLCVALMQGCSFFSAKNESESPAGGDGQFKATVSPANNPVPMPIEVATEIAQINDHKKSAHATINSPESLAAPRSLASEDNVVDGVADPSSTSSDEVHEAGLKIDKKSASRPPHGKKTAYKVRPGDTLMKISFEKYGDVYRWHEIYDANRVLIRDFNILAPGTVLSIFGGEYVVIEKNGKSYLIKRNDTLVKISKWLYGSSHEWKSLWLNNRQLIHDPNRIYAGFTMYYKPKEKQ